MKKYFRYTALTLFRRVCHVFVVSLPTLSYISAHAGKRLVIEPAECIEVMEYKIRCGCDNEIFAHGAAKNKVQLGVFNCRILFSFMLRRRFS